MAANARTGVPVKAADGERGDTRAAVGGLVRHRVNALLLDTMALADEQHKKGKRRDIRELLLDELYNSNTPSVVLERWKALSGEDKTGTAGAPAGVVVNAAQLFLAGTRQVNEAMRPEPVTIDAEPVSAGVQSGLGDW